MEPVPGFQVIDNYIINNSDKPEGYRVLKSKEEMLNFSEAAKVSAFATFSTDFSKKNLIVISLKVNDDITNFTVRKIEVIADKVNITMEMWMNKEAPNPIKGVDYTFIEADKDKPLKLGVEIFQKVKST